MGSLCFFIVLAVKEHLAEEILINKQAVRKET